MKKKKRIFITKIFSLLLLGIISVTLLGSWTYDNNGNLVSENIWNEQVELGRFNITNGSYVDDVNRIRCKDYISVTENSTYYVIFNNSNDTDFNYGFWDINYNYLSGNYITQCSSITAPSNAYYFKFYMGTGYGTSYKNDIMITNLGAFDIVNQVNGFTTITRRTGVVDLGSLTWSYNAGNNLFYTSLSLMKPMWQVGVNKNIKCEAYETYTGINLTDMPNNSITSTNIITTTDIAIKNNAYNNIENFKQGNQGILLYYELNDSTRIITYEPSGKWYSQENYNSIVEDYESWRNDYQELSQQYDELESNFNTLQQNYNDLSTRFSTLTDEYDTLLEEKQELQQQLADLNAELNLLRPYIFNSSDIVVKVGNATQTGDNFVSTSVVNNVSSYFDVYGSFDLDTLYSNYSGFGSSYNAICFEVPNYNLLMYNVSFSFTGYPDMLYRLDYQDSVGNNLVIAKDFTESYTDLYGFSIVSGLRNSNMWDSSQPIEYCSYSKIVFVGLNVGALNVKNLNFSSSAGYSEGFNQGYNSIKQQTDVIITRLNNHIDTLNSTIDNLHTQISDLQNQLANSIGWRPLFFAMADTPLKVVSNVLGFELFGINLFQAFIGIITALAIIWLIRKIWK